MKEFLAKDRGIVPGQDVTVALAELLAELQNVSGQKRVVIESGEYYIDADKAAERMLYITNSCADSEWDKDQTPHLSRVAFMLERVSDLEIIATGAKFIMNGQLTNIAFDHCENVTVEGLTIDAVSPRMHTLTVKAKSAFAVDWEYDSETTVEKRGAKLYFVGKDYAEKVNESAVVAWHNGFIPHNDENALSRKMHPFAFAMSIKQTAGRGLRAIYLNTARFKVGDRFIVFMHHRRNAGFFVNSSRNIILRDVTSHFNYGLCYVAQDCHNLTIEGCRFVPRDHAIRPMCSVADFIQLCMCTGDILVKDNKFDGAGDDLLNVHGFHYCVSKKDGNKVVVGYIHPQSFGFNPLHVGDTVDFVNRLTLAINGSAKILSSNMIDTHHIELELDCADKLNVGDVIEDVDRCPNLTFTGNRSTRIITRGLLITTRGKVLVEDNVFDSCTMHNILVSNDAKSWYESGRVTDVTVRKNVFNRCPQYTVCIMPENGGNSNIVHSGITIEDNAINSENGGFYVKNAEKVRIVNNRFTKKGYEHKNINSQIDADIEF